MDHGIAIKIIIVETVVTQDTLCYSTKLRPVQYACPCVDRDPREMQAVDGVRGRSAYQLCYYTVCAINTPPPLHLKKETNSSNSYISPNTP